MYTVSRNLEFIRLFIMRNICNYTHLVTTMSLHKQLLDVPRVGDAPEPVALGHANNVNHLVLGEYRSDRNLLLETAPWEVSPDRDRFSKSSDSSSALKIKFIISFLGFSQSSWSKLMVRLERIKKSPVTGSLRYSSAPKRDLMCFQANLQRFSNTCNEGIRWCKEI